MRRSAGSFVFVALGAVALNATALPPARGVEELRAADKEVVAKGYRADRLRGSKVRNERKEHIGVIVDVVVYRDLPAATILQVGGFLGIASRLIAVPLKSLVLD